MRFLEKIHNSPHFEDYEDPLMEIVQYGEDPEHKYDPKIMGQYVLTGSHRLELKAAISQSLAGRTAIIKLLPFSISELEAAGIAYESFEEYSVKGFLPQVYDRLIRPLALPK